MNSLDDLAATQSVISIPGALVVETPNHPVIARVHAIPDQPAGGKRPKMSFDYLSPSQVKTYLRCQASYLFSYFYKLSRSEDSALVFGSAVHFAGDAYLSSKRHLVSAGMPVVHEDLKAHAIDQAAFYIRTNVSPVMTLEASAEFYKTQWKKGPEETFESLLAGVQFAAGKIADEVWINLDVIEVEKGYLIEWKDGKTLPFLGFADSIIRTPNGPAVYDLKTGAEKHMMDAKLDIALSAYAQSYELFSGVATRDVGYHSFVRNKAPKIVTVATKRSDDDLSRLYSISRTMTKSLAQGIYIPADNSMVCGTCNFYDRCRKEFAA